MVTVLRRQPHPIIVIQVENLGQSGTGTGFSPSSSVPLSVSLHMGSTLMYHLGDEQ
jgi:hypothetical protein